MKIKNIIPFVGLLALMFISCEEQIMDWHKDPSHGEVTVSELPLPLAEKITRYDFLKNYTDFKLGVGIGLDLYMNDETYQKIANENFDDVTVGYAMKHGPMVNANGEINFNAVDAFIAKTKEAGLTVFGHTLMWHTNQNASYLNGLIAPTIIPGAAGTNLLDLSGLTDGSLTGWGAWNSGDGITVVENSGLTDGSQAVKLISGAASSDPWSLQLITPEIIVEPTHAHEISFYIKSDQPGKGRISFAGLSNNYPWMDWLGTGSATEAFETTSQWQQVKFTVSDFTGDPFKVSFDMGYLPAVTYYIDVDNISVVDLDAEPTFVNMITNGDFEDGTLNPWGGWGNSSTREISADGQGYGDVGYAMVLTNPTAAEYYSAQQVYTFSEPLVEGKEYSFSFMVKASATADLQVEIQSPDYSANYYGGITVGTTWTQVSGKLTPTSADRGKFIFDFGKTAATYYIDDVVFTDGSNVSSGPIIIEKTDQEKTQIIGDAMEDWISNMVGHYKNDIQAWDVVNEPMRENGEVRDGNVSDPADDEFYWVKYLGKDYAVDAFKLARQYGNATDILFINDYNLEYSLEKCQGLIDYVTYIEGKGAQVDGIGTQMHISIDSDTSKMIQMFQKLASSGKLIKISELDVRLGTNAPTAAQLEAQSNMYQFVMDMYMKYIPENQRFGVTIWGISDNTQEHEFWLPDESPNLWDANYERKHAYKGCADGLAGRDVSEDFSGELVY
ncbi:MAG: endo-1,4-beta-xylanase [Salinivirgaceae bacterium]